MSHSPLAAIAANHQPRPRLPFGEARQGNNIPVKPQPRVKAQMPSEPPRQQPPQPQQRDGAVRENPRQLPEPKKEKVRPPSPPSVIRDQKNTLVFTKVGFLGEVCIIYLSMTWYLR
jgi:hypothetical protein